MINRIKDKDGRDHESCDFGLRKFHLRKRKKKYSAEKSLLRNRPSWWRKSTTTTSTTTKKSTTTTTTTTNKNTTTTTTTTKKSTTTTTTTTTGHTPSVIFLDFTGFTVTGTSWNYSGDIVCSPANLSSEEVDVILEGVEEDYNKYNVTITVDENVYNTTHPSKRMRCILTDSWEWYGKAGGVAFVGSFTWPDNTPCFVFTSLLKYDSKKIKEAASHEIGHTLGLYHQASYDGNCVKTSDYNAGCCGEAPVMGVSYYQENGHWWIGPNSFGCNSIQNDNAIITSVLGLK